jgi:TolB-like protein
LILRNVVTRLIFTVARGLHHWSPRDINILVLVVLAGVLVAACAGSPSYYRSKTPAGDGSRKLAVLPPVNLSRNEKASDIVLDALIVALLDAKVFDVVDPGAVETVINRRRIRLTDRLPLETIQGIGEELGVEQLMVGSVNEFSAVEGRDGSTAVVSISLRIIGCADGKIAWASTHSRRGDDSESVFGFGRISSPEQLATDMVRQMTETLIP